MERVSSCLHFVPWATKHLGVHSRICLHYGGQLRDLRLLRVFAQNWTVGVDVVHGKKEGDSFYLGPKKVKEITSVMWLQRRSCSFSFYIFKIKYFKLNNLTLNL